MLACDEVYVQLACWQHERVSYEIRKSATAAAATDDDDDDVV